MTGHGTKYERKRDEAIVALLTHRNLEEAARAIGVGTKTLFRWTQMPEFQEAFRAARRNAFSQSIARLQQASSAAVSTLIKVMIEPGTPSSTRVRAADSVLNHAAKAIEIEDIEVRVSMLEHAMESDAKNP